MYDLFKKIYKSKILHYESTFNYFNYIDNLIIQNPHSNELEIIKDNNLYISNVIASFIGFETYKIQESLDIELSNNLPNLFSYDNNIIYILNNNEHCSLNFIISYNNNIINEINILDSEHKKVLDMIDFRPTNVYKKINKYVMLYEETLKKNLLKYNININKQMVDNLWINTMEILHEINFKELYKNSKNVNMFHLCYLSECINHSIKYYIKKNIPGLEYNKETFKDGMNDITLEGNIKHYKKICNNTDWFISSCFSLNKIKITKNHLLLLICEMIFVLYNLKNTGNCIFKISLPIKYAIIIDMFYTFYCVFDKIKLFKPTQNKFAPEFYIICLNYNNSLLTNKHFDVLFDVIKNANNIENVSIYNNNYNDMFKHIFVKGISMIENNYLETIKLQLFYVDFWENIPNKKIIKETIKKYIKIKNKDFINKYIK
jgi:hypothetical protein